MNDQQKCALRLLWVDIQLGLFATLAYIALGIAIIGIVTLILLIAIWVYRSNIWLAAAIAVIIVTVCVGYLLWDKYRTHMRFCKAMGVK